MHARRAGERRTPARASVDTALKRFSLSLACAATGLLAGCAPGLDLQEEPSRDWARPLRTVAFERTPARVARGGYLADNLLACGSCHGERDLSAPGAAPRPGRAFVGRVYWEADTQRIVAPNLTPDRETGAGTWSDDMLARAIREGVGHDGRALHRYMPYESFRGLSDEDVASIVVYLRSLEPVRNPLPRTKLSDERRRRIEEDLEPLTGPVPMPDTSDAVTRGRYYIGLADCVGCHTSWYTDYNPGLLAGGNPVPRRRTGQQGTVFSSNITSDSSGIGNLDRAGFIALMRSGRGGSMDANMPWWAFRSLSDDDLDAIFQALHSVPPARHWISNGPPSHCDLCGQEHGMGERNRRTRPEGVRLPAAALDELAGAYRSDAHGWTTVITREGARLYASEGDDESIELVPVSDSRCLAPGWPSPISFERDAGGRVNALFFEDLEAERFRKID